MSIPLHTQLFINGEFVNAVDGKTFNACDPATEEVIAAVQEGGKADVDKAVVAARAAFEGTWGSTPGAARRHLLNKLADLIEKHADRLAQNKSKDNGKPLAVAKGADVSLSVSHFRYFAGWADKGDVREDDSNQCDGPQPFRHDSARACGSCGVHHALEFPFVDDDVEACAPPGYRLHVRHENIRKDAALGASHVPPYQGSRFPSWSCQRGLWPWLHGRVSGPTRRCG